MIKPIIATLKSGEEHLIHEQKETAFTLFDFWKWNSSNILSNSTRGVFAEFIVASALNIDIKTPRVEWAEYDLETKDGIKIEVKSASYLQSWTQKDYSKISFSIKNKSADVYIFCLLKHLQEDTIDPLNLDQWEFYIVHIKEIKNYKRSKKSITLNSLRTLTSPIGYSEIKNTIYFNINRND